MTLKYVMAIQLSTNPATAIPVEGEHRWIDSARGAFREPDG
jgi:hypothetical protein